MGRQGADEGALTLAGRALHLDVPLLSAILLVAGSGLGVLYTAAGGDAAVVGRQVLRLGVGLVVMLALAQVPVHYLRLWAPWFFAAVLASLLAVLVMGEVGQGAQRWLDLGLFRFQPSELMKLAMPMALAWYLAEQRLPPRAGQAAVGLGLVFVPAGLIAVQPDLGTALLVAAAGIFVIFLAGISWRLIAALLALAAGSTPILWHLMHTYQRERVLSFLDPDSDPLGSGYHIIQSEIAIGSGGLYGKGWLNGTQAQLDFLPERATDFIFAVYGEEFGLLGALALLSAYAVLVFRGLAIAARARETFARLLAGSLSLTFFVYLFVNIGMVTGLLPVVGVPLPLVSYGGTSMVTLMAGFGMLMAIHSHRKLLVR